MKTNLLILVPIILLILSCTNNQPQKEFERLDVWEDIRTAVKEKRINYLQELSKDTLDCIECNKGESKVAKEEFFINYLEQMEQLDTKEYSVYAEKYEEVVGFNTRYRINYAFNKDRKMEGYNSIYTILKGENGIQFQGVFSVP